MSNATNDAKKKDWFKSVKAQFKRIIWPTQDDIVKETSVVLAATVLLGAIIALLDRGLLLVVDMIISL